MDAAAALRARRAGRSRPSVGARLEQAYVAVLAALVVGAMVLSGGRGLLVDDGCSTAVCLSPPSRPWLAAAVVAGGFGLLWRWLVTAGPVGATRAEVSWLLMAPLDRGRLLRASALRAGAVAAVVGGLVGWFGATAARGDGPQGSWVVLLAGTAAGAVVGVVAAAAAVAVEASGRARPVVLPGTVALVVAAAAAGAAVLGATSDGAAGLEAVRAALLPAVSRPDAPALPVLPVVAVVVVAVVVLVAAVRAASWALPRLRLVDLLAAGDVQADLHGSVLLLDAGPVRSRLRTRAAGGRARSRRGAWRGGAALLHREAVTLTRRGPALASAAGLVLVPPVLGLTGGPGLALVVAVLLGVAVARPVAASLPLATGAGALARSLPFAPGVALGLLLVVPGAVVLVWASVVGGLLAQPAWVGVALAACALSGLVRGSRPPDLAGTGALVMTEAGPVPVGLVARVLRGPDAALVGAVPLLLGLGPVAGTVTPLVVLAAVARQHLRGSR